MSYIMVVELCTDIILNTTKLWHDTTQKKLYCAAFNLFLILKRHIL